MPTLSCLSAFLTLFTILQAKYYHQSTTHTSVPAVLQRCHQQPSSVGVG